MDASPKVLRDDVVQRLLHQHDPKPDPAHEAPTQALVAKVEHREIELRPGLTATVRKPAKAVSFRLARVLGAQATNGMLDMYCRALLWITALNGTSVENVKLDKLSDFEQFVDMIGDDGLENLLKGTLWADVDVPVELEALKKLVGDAYWREVALLVSSGWHPDLVMQMDDMFRTGLFIIHSEQQSPVGARFNFANKAWEVPKPEK